VVITRVETVSSLVFEVTFTWVDFGVVLTGREILHFLDVVVITDEPLNKGKYCFLM
jgi:hypothetical protein